MNNYDEQLDDLDCSVFSGEILETHLEEFEYYLKRWQRTLDSHKNMMESEEK